MKPNIKALEEWIAVLEAAPAEKINQTGWARTDGKIDPATGYLCASTACAGGWATLVPSLKGKLTLERKTMVNYITNLCYRDDEVPSFGVGAIKRAFGLNSRQADLIVDTYSDPGESNPPSKADVIKRVQKVLAECRGGT